MLDTLRGNSSVPVTDCFRELHPEEPGFTIDRESNALVDPSRLGPFLPSSSSTFSFPPFAPYLPLSTPWEEGRRKKSGKREGRKEKREVTLVPAYGLSHNCSPKQRLDYVLLYRNNPLDDRPLLRLDCLQCRPLPTALTPHEQLTDHFGVEVMLAPQKVAEAD